MTEHEILADHRYVLLDFDGPVCSVFAGYPAATIAQELVGIAEREGLAGHPDWSAVDDPHEVLRRTHAISLQVAQKIESALQRAEITAARTASPRMARGPFLRRAPELAGSLR